MFDDIIEYSHASWDGYGGSRGAAKSGYIRRGMLRRRLEYPGTAGQILRRVWDDVQKNHVDKFFEEFPGLLPYYHVQGHVVTIPTNGLPSRLYFDSAETETDVKRKAYGPEYMDIFVDQAEQFTEKELKLLKTSCRWPNTPEHRCKFGLFFNPGGPGAAFLRRVFHTKEYHEREKAEDFAFVQAFGWDNVEWCRAALTHDGFTEQDFYGWTDQKRFDYFITRSQYGRELNALPQAMRIGHLLGNFDKFAGQYFDIFDIEKHTGHCVIQPYTVRWMGIDWGRAHATAAYWNAKETGITKTYREYCETERTPKSAAQEIVDVTPEEERKHIDAIFLSHDAFAQRTDPRTIAIQMGEVFRANGMPEPVPAPKDPVGGAVLCYELLRSSEVLIDPSCRKLIECLPLVTRDEDKPESTQEFEGNDPFDGWKYGLQGRYGSYEGRKPVDQEVEEQLEAFAKVNPSLLAVREAQIRHEHKLDSKPVRLFRPKHVPKWRQ